MSSLELCFGVVQVRIDSLVGFVGQHFICGPTLVVGPRLVPLKLMTTCWIQALPRWPELDFEVLRGSS